MAQTGYTPISLYYTTTAAAVPTAGNLVAGELALNTNDGKLYYKNSSGVVTLLAGATAGPAGGSNTQVQFNSSGALAGSANLTFDGTNLTMSAASAILGISSGSSGVANTAKIVLGATTNYTVIGANCPLQIHNITSAGSGLAATDWINNAGGAPIIAVAKSRGANVGTRAVVINGDNLGTFAFYGDDGVSTNFTQAASITGYVDGTVSTGVVQGSININATTKIQNVINGSTVGAFSSTGLAVTGTLTSTLDATIYGLTVGRGGGAVSTNTAVGASALAATATGGFNSTFGYQAGQSITSGSSNTAIGYQANATNISGNQVTAVGSLCLSVNTASNNTAVGFASMNVNTSGSGNTALGWYSLYSNTTASNNTAVGYQAGYSANGPSSIIAVGYQAGYTGILRGLTIGSQAGYSASGDDNICIGYQAGYYTTATTTGTSNIFLGQYCRGSGATISNEYVFGYNLAGKGANTAYIGGSSGAYNQANSLNWSVTSDQRIKKNIVDNNVGLEKITAIRVRNFEYRLPEEVDAELKPTDAIQKEGVQLGVIAQELQAVLPDCVKTESTGVMSVNSDALMWHMINAIKELSAKITALENK